MIKYTEKALKELIKSGKTALVVTHTDWCSKCRRVLPFITVLESNYKNKVEFVDIDGDLVSDGFIRDFGVQELPTVNFVKDGVIYDPCTDLDTPEAISAYIQEGLK